MDKKLIERIALETAKEFDETYAEATMDYESVEFFTSFLARIDAERGKEAVAWVEVADRHEGPYNFHGKELLDSGKHSLFLSAPTIPEGMAMVPIEPTEEMLMEGRRADTAWCEVETDINVFESGLVAIYQAMIAAAQGERNLTDERIDELAYGTRDFDFNRFVRAIEAEVMAEVCSAQNSEYAPQDCLSLTDATQVRMEAQEPVASANDAAKMRFFRDMTSPERRKVFEVFGIESAVLNEVRSLSDETLIFKHLFAAQQPPAPCPKCAEAKRIEALATAKLGDEIIKNGSLQDKLAQLECDFALEHDDKLELQAKVAELEKRDDHMAKRLRACQSAWDAKDLRNQLSAIVFEEAHGVAFERAYSQQAALIEKCERCLEDLSGMGWAEEALAAIAAHKS